MSSGDITTARTMISMISKIMELIKTPRMLKLISDSGILQKSYKLYTVMTSLQVYSKLLFF